MSPDAFYLQSKFPNPTIHYSYCKSLNILKILSIFYLTPVRGCIFNSIYDVRRHFSQLFLCTGQDSHVSLPIILSRFKYLVSQEVLSVFKDKESFVLWLKSHMNNLKTKGLSTTSCSLYFQNLCLADHNPLKFIRRQGGHGKECCSNFFLGQTQCISRQGRGWGRLSYPGR